MPILSGKRLGPYEILSAIGAGGMGEVYRAKDTRLDRIVAIKILPEHLADRAELRERFEREARSDLQPESSRTSALSTTLVIRMELTIW